MATLLQRARLLVQMRFRYTPRALPSHKAVALHVRRFSKRAIDRVAGKLPRSVLVRAIAPPIDVHNFAALGLIPELQQAVSDINIATPTEVQALAFPLIAAGKNVLVASHTGSGKTLAYLLPIVQQLKCQEANDGFVGRVKKPRALVLGPTRELTEQIGGVAKSLSYAVKFRSAVINAGSKPGIIKRTLATPIDLVVSTPSKLLESMEAGQLSIADVQYLVLDEADTMFDKGFGPEVRRVIGPLKRRGGSYATILVSATMTKAVKALIAEYVPNVENAVTSTLHKGIQGSQHSFVPVEAGRDKIDVLNQSMRETFDAYMYQVIGPDTRRGKRVMVFCNSVASCRAVDHCLNESGLLTVCYHGEMPIPARKTTIAAFTDAAVENRPTQPVLVCTDLAARGLDMPSPVSHVVNFDMPNSPIDYLHRSGRTARAGSSGRVSSLMQSASDRTLGHRIEWALNRGEPLDELSADKSVKPKGVLPGKRDSVRGSNHRKTLLQAAASGGRGRGRGGRLGAPSRGSSRGKGPPGARGGLGRGASRGLGSVAPGGRTQRGQQSGVAGRGRAGPSRRGRMR